MTKKKAVLTHLQMHGKITSWEAIQKFKATRLSAIIFNLRKEGHNIESINRHDKDGGSNYAEYILHKEMNGQYGLGL